MKKLMIGLMVALMLVLSSCDFGDFTGHWNDDNNVEDNPTLAELIDAELLADADVDAAIEEEIEIDIPTTLSKAAPGPGNNDQGRGKRRVRLMVKQAIDSVDVQKDIEYTTDDTALVTLTKTVYGTLVINQTDTAIVDTPEVWEKDYVYTSTSYMQFVQVVCDSCENDSTETDSVSWKLIARSIEVGQTDSILNTIESVALEADDDSTMLVYDDPAALYEVVRGRTPGWGSFRERPGQQETEVYVTVDGDDDVNVLGSSGRYFKLLDDGEGLDLTADDNIYSGTILKGRGQSRIRVRMITTATFINEDAPVEIATWFLPVK